MYTHDNYERAKNAITNDYVPLVILFAITIAFNMVGSLLGKIPYIGGVLQFIITVSSMPLSIIIFDLGYVRGNKSSDLGQIFSILGSFWTEKGPKVVKPYIAYFLKLFLMVLCFILPTITIFTFAIAKMSAVLILLGVIFLIIALFACIYLSFRFSVKFQYDLIAIYYGRTSNSLRKDEVNSFALKLALWGFVPILGPLMVLAKTYIYYLKIAYDVLENEQSSDYYGGGYQQNNYQQNNYQYNGYQNGYQQNNQYNGQYRNPYDGPNNGGYR